MRAPRLLATRTCETTKIPAGMQKSDLWSFRYTSEQKKSELIKNTTANDILWNLCFTYSKSVQGQNVTQNAQIQTLKTDHTSGTEKNIAFLIIGLRYGPRRRLCPKKDNFKRGKDRIRTLKILKVLKGGVLQFGHVAWVDS